MQTKLNWTELTPQSINLCEYAAYLCASNYFYLFILLQNFKHPRKLNNLHTHKHTENGTSY